LAGGHVIFRPIGLAIAITVGVLTPVFAAERVEPSAQPDKRNATMTQKLDPNLRALVESAKTPRSHTSVDVIVGLSGPASEPQLEALRDRGLQVRSVIGDVLTGTAEVDKIPDIAEHKLVTTIEASSPLFPE
jgi:hypothetical protein